MSATSALYEVLHVDPEADRKVIRAAYVRRAKKCHPDAGGAAGWMVVLNEAWTVLGDAERPAAYNAARRTTARPPPAWAARSEQGEARTVSAPPRGGAAAGSAGSVLDFGRYAGWTLEALASKDPDYLAWLARAPIGRQYRSEIDALLSARLGGDSGGSQHLAAADARVAPALAGAGRALAADRRIEPVTRGNRDGRRLVYPHMTQSNSRRASTVIAVATLLLVLLLAGCTSAGAGGTALPAATTAWPGLAATATAPSVPPEIVGGGPLAATPRPAATPPPTPRATPRSTGGPALQPTTSPSFTATGVPATLLPPIVGVVGRVVAGPTCPVQRLPPDPACADRPVAGAVLVVTDAGGTEVGRATSDANGEFAIPLPPGSYVLTPQPVAGLMGTARPIQFTATAGSPADLDVTYDTGIR